MHSHQPSQACGDQKTVLSARFHLPLCLRQGLCFLLLHIPGQQAWELLGVLLPLPGILGRSTRTKDAYTAASMNSENSKFSKLHSYIYHIFFSCSFSSFGYLKQDLIIQPMLAPNIRHFSCLPSTRVADVRQYTHIQLQNFFQFVCVCSCSC